MTGSNDGTICLWSQMKKKPAHYCRNAHPNRDSQATGSGPEAGWIQSVAVCRGSDLMVILFSVFGFSFPFFPVLLLCVHLSSLIPFSSVLFICFLFHVLHCPILPLLFISLLCFPFLRLS